MALFGTQRLESSR